jgi:3-hydroxyisobutyrate dehydrogenase-like beta-hydroxyacid dehydrogenase
MSTVAKDEPVGRVREIKTVGVVGWGRMGAEMGRWLMRRGVPVVGTDPSADAVESMRAAGATPLPGASQVAATADLVLVVVVDDAQVRDVVFGADGVIESARPGTVVAICSSVRPDTCEIAAAVAGRRRVKVLDVALVGGERAAEQGGLTLMCGGDAEALDRCSPVFSAFAKDICHLGALGTGQVAKTANNILLWSALRADVEVLRLAKALGVAPGRLRNVLNSGTGANQPLADWGMHRLRWPKKDLEVALALAEEAGVDVPFVRALEPLMAELTKDDLDDLR